MAVAFRFPSPLEVDRFLYKEFVDATVEYTLASVPSRGG